MFVRFTVAAVSLVAALIATQGASTTSTSSEHESRTLGDPYLRVTNPVIERDNIRVQLLELTRASSPNQSHVVTSVLFVVEHLGDSDIVAHAERSPLRFFDANGKAIVLPVAGCAKSGTTTYDFGRFDPPWHVEMPNPTNPSRALIVRQWFCHDIPGKAATINDAFGRNDELVDFQFTLDRR